MLGTTVLTHLGKERREDFKYTVQMLELRCTALTELEPFLLLEELSVLINELEDQPKTRTLLLTIYRLLKKQAYKEFRAVVEYIPMSQQHTATVKP